MLKKLNLKIIFCLTLSFCAIGINQNILAQTEENIDTLLNLCNLPIELELLENEQIDQNSNIITADTISEESLSIPSLWWAKQQFDPFKGKLIRNWLAYGDQRRIDLVVNRQLWSLMNYLDRYRFINQFGTVARNYNYNLRIINQYQECLATYQLTRDFDDPFLTQWEINLYSSGDNNLQIQN